MDDSFPHRSQTEVGLGPAHEDEYQWFCWVQGGLSFINTTYSGYILFAWELRGWATFQGVWNGYLIKAKMLEGCSD